MEYVKAIQLHSNTRQILLFGMTGVVVVSALIYVYFLNITILNVIERKHTEQRISETNVHINKLELSYLDLSKTVNPALAESLGFQESKTVTFANLGDHKTLAKLGE